MSPKIIVIDDVLPDIDQVRGHALTLKYGDIKSHGVTYPGVNADPDAAKAGWEMVLPAIAKYLNATPLLRMAFWRLAVESHRPDIYIHPDGDGEGTWAAILYLTPNEDCVGGTAFWTHKETGLSELPENGKDLVQRFVEDGKDESKWTMNSLVGMRYNRLLIMRSNQFHARYPERFPFTEPENGRCTFTAFFDTLYRHDS
jgi:hypothetical protein